MPVFIELWTIFSFSFLVALTGALAPGPLLTYTIMQTAQDSDKGYLVGVWVILGHAIIEAIIILFLLLGFSLIFKNIIVKQTIGVLGGSLLVCFGCKILYDVFKNKIQYRFIETHTAKTPDVPSKIGYTSPKGSIIGGALISMANPYWWVWWATIGCAFMLQFDVTFEDWGKLTAFYLGHESGDLFWYLLVSILVFFGVKYLNKKVYYGMLAVCGVFMIGFGFYLSVSTFM